MHQRDSVEQTGRSWPPEKEELETIRSACLHRVRNEAFPDPPPPAPLRRFPVWLDHELPEYSI